MKKNNLLISSIFFVLCFLFLMYSLFIYSNLPVQPPSVDVKVLAGKTVWQKYNCGACHQVYGLGGYLGPDLTNVYSTRGENYIKTFIQSGTKIMPAFSLEKDELNEIVFYLKNIDSSGISNPQSFKINKDGTVSQNQH